MIHYHGTPIGGSRQDVARFLVGRHALVPFFRQDDIGIVGEVCQSFVVDCSEYTIWKQGGELDIPAYVKWCYSLYRHPAFDWAIIPDSIEGGEAENDARLRDWPSDIRGVPVYHLHEDLGRLQRLIKAYRTVALGSSGQWSTPGSKDWWIRMAEVMDVACDDFGRPLASYHGLRMLDPRIFEHLPLKSGDSTNAAVNCGSKSRFGMYVPSTPSQRAAVIADRIESAPAAAIWVRPPVQTETLFGVEFELTA